MRHLIKEPILDSSSIILKLVSKTYKSQIKNLRKRIQNNQETFSSQDQEDLRRYSHIFPKAKWSTDMVINPSTIACTYFPIAKWSIIKYSNKYKILNTDVHNIIIILHIFFCFCCLLCSLFLFLLAILYLSSPFPTISFILLSTTFLLSFSFFGLNSWKAKTK